MANVPAYTTEELASRVADGSTDLNRLASTVADLQVSVMAMANWINEQIQVQQVQAAAATVTEPASRKKG